MPVTILDVIVVVVVLISAILAMVRGFVREVLSVASWVAAAAAAYFFYPHVLPLVQPYFDSNTVATIVAAAAIFFVALIVASYITMKISDFVIDSRVGAIDRVLGFVFGAVRGLLLMIVAVWFFDLLVQASAGLDRQRPDTTDPRLRRRPADRASARGFRDLGEGEDQRRLRRRRSRRRATPRSASRSTRPPRRRRTLDRGRLATPRRSSRASTS